MIPLSELKKYAQGMRILYVEDEPELRESVAEYLRKIFDDVRVAANGKEGLACYEEQRVDIVISDISMPVMNGIEMLQAIKTLYPEQRCVITSAYTESQFFIDAIKLGVSAYIIKPIDYAQMNEVLFTTVRAIEQEKELSVYHHHLEETISAKVAAYKRLESARVEDYEKVLLALVKMIEQRDSYTAGHSQRVARYSEMLARSMGYDESACQKLYQAGILHDIGKVATPDAILLKPERLNAIEYHLIKEHVNVGVSILKDVPMFSSLVPIIANHHERCDGLGYPNGLRGEAIDPLARIMIVADAFDAMTTSRIYRHKKSLQDALKELQDLSGKQFSPEVVKHALIVFKDITIDTEASQLPTSALEEERFVYFYRDSLTDIYNQKYLSILLLRNSFCYEYTYIYIFSLHNFTAYNHYMGWDEGDKLLRSLAGLLASFYPNAPLFRIHANDFIVLDSKPFEEAAHFKTHMDTLLGVHLNYSVRCFDIKTLHIDSMQALEAIINPTLASARVGH